MAGTSETQCRRFYHIGFSIPIARNLFDLSVGDDNLFHGDRYRWSLQFTAINLTNKVALYNFLSTFSGTHYVTPRTLTAEVGFHF